MEDDEKIKRLKQLGAVDQSIAGATTLGEMGGALYTSLIANGTPVKLAATMTRDWFFLQMTRALWGPSMMPSPPFWDIERGGEQDDEQ